MASLGGAGAARGTRPLAPAEPAESGNQRQTATCLGPICHQQHPLHLDGGQQDYREKIQSVGLLS